MNFMNVFLEVNFLKWCKLEQIRLTFSPFFLKKKCLLFFFKKQREGHWSFSHQFISKWLQQPGLGRAEVRCWKLRLDSLHGWQSPQAHWSHPTSQEQVDWRRSGQDWNLYSAKEWRCCEPQLAVLCCNAGPGSLVLHTLPLVWKRLSRPSTPKCILFFVNSPNVQMVVYLVGNELPIHCDVLLRRFRSRRASFSFGLFYLYQ